jgi:DNA-binding NarL/FixJ family response regulator
MPAAMTTLHEIAEDPGISPAEQRVLAVLRSGASNREIAATLYLSVRTVESHISSLLGKTGCRNRTQLVLRAPIQP